MVCSKENFKEKISNMVYEKSKKYFRGWGKKIVENLFEKINTKI
jgi:hypothetical protein